MLYLNIGYKINVYIVYDANIMTFFESTHTICKKSWRTVASNP